MKGKQCINKIIMACRILSYTVSYLISELSLFLGCVQQKLRRTPRGKNFFIKRLLKDAFIATEGKIFFKQILKTEQKNA